MNFKLLLLASVAALGDGQEQPLGNGFLDALRGVAVDLHRRGCRAGTEQRSRAWTAVDDDLRRRAEGDDDDARVRLAQGDRGSRGRLDEAAVVDERVGGAVRHDVDRGVCPAVG